MDCALDLMRRLPPQQIEKNLSDLIDLVPDLCEDLLSSVDQPLKIARDKQDGLFAATPPLEVMKLLLSTLAPGNKGECLMVADVKRAYFHA